jgi:hypothetical protein
MYSRAADIEGGATGTQEAFKCERVGVGVNYYLIQVRYHPVFVLGLHSHDASTSIHIGPQHDGEDIEHNPPPQQGES